MFMSFAIYFELQIYTPWDFLIVILQFLTPLDVPYSEPPLE